MEENATSTAVAEPSEQELEKEVKKLPSKTDVISVRASS